MSILMPFMAIAGVFIAYVAINSIALSVSNLLDE
jgi:hypothetical protein